MEYIGASLLASGKPRFDPEAKGTSWLHFLKQLEAVLSHIRFVVIGNTSVESADGSVVAEKRGTVVGTKKGRTQWMLELHASIIATLLNQSSLREKAKQQNAPMNDETSNVLALSMMNSNATVPESNLTYASH